MNTKIIPWVLCLLLWNTAITLILCAVTLHFAHNYTNQATQPHAIKAAHKP